MAATQAAATAVSLSPSPGVTLAAAAKWISNTTGKNCIAHNCFGPKHAANFSCRDASPKTGTRTRRKVSNIRIAEPPSPPCTLLLAALSQPLPVRVRQGPRLDSLPGLPLLCLVPCASCLWLTSRWACKCESNTMPSAKVPKTNNNNKKRGRGRGGKDNKKCGSHTYTKNRKLNFRLCQVRGRKRKNCCRNCCRNTQAAAHTHTHGSTSVCMSGCCNYYERSERTPDTGSASFCIPSSRQTVQTETKYLTTMHPGYSPEGLHNWVGVAAPHETDTVKEKRRGEEEWERDKVAAQSSANDTGWKLPHAAKPSRSRIRKRKKERGTESKIVAGAGWVERALSS